VRGERIGYLAAAMRAEVADACARRPGRYSLASLLREWAVPSSFYANMSPHWECTIAPTCWDDSQIKEHVIAQQAAMAPMHCVEGLHAKVGRDGLDFVCKSSWSRFPRPKIAMVGGWGEPGDLAQGADHLTLVNSIAEVLQDTRPLNLQMFHRDKAEEPLASELRWPCPEFFGEQRGFSVDKATRISQRGAVTWWHLDDCGEFTYQAALPLLEHTFGNHSLLLGPTGKPVVKIFIFADKKAYDLIVQDEEVNRTVCRPRLSTPGSCCSPHVTTCCSSSIDIPCKILALQGRFHGLHLLDSPELCFPSPQDLEKADNKNVSGSEWPVFTVALLEAGGPPLLSPPNVQHVVLTLQNCVMVEERLVSVLFLDEVAYFLNLVNSWAEPPILYDFVREGLRNAATVDTVVDLLLTILDGECGASNSGDVGGIHPSPAIGKVTKERAFLSLCALVAHDGTHFRLDPDRLQDIDEKLSSSYPSLILRNDSRANELSIIFDQEGRWHARRTGNQTEGTHHFAGVSAISGKGYCARVHDKGCVRFGPVRSSPEHAQSDHDLLQKSIAEGNLADLQTGDVALMTLALCTREAKPGACTFTYGSGVCPSQHIPPRWRGTTANLTHKGQGGSRICEQGR